MTVKTCKKGSDRTDYDMPPARGKIPPIKLVSRDLVPSATLEVPLQSQLAVYDRPERK